MNVGKLEANTIQEVKVMKKFEPQTISPLEELRANRINNKNYSKEIIPNIEKRLKEHNAQVDEENKKNTMPPRPGRELSRGHAGSKHHPRG